MAGHERAWPKGLFSQEQERTYTRNKTDFFC